MRFQRLQRPLAMFPMQRSAFAGRVGGTRWPKRPRVGEDSTGTNQGFDFRGSEDSIGMAEDSTGIPAIVDSYDINCLTALSLGPNPYSLIAIPQIILSLSFCR
jgi:hypothetical protein